MKKITVLMLVLCALLMVACGGSPAPAPTSEAPNSELEEIRRELEETKQQLEDVKEQLPEPAASMPDEITYDYFLAETGWTDAQAAPIWEVLDELGVRDDMKFFTVSESDYDDSFTLTAFSDGPKQEELTSTLIISFSGNSVESVYCMFPELQNPFIYTDGEKSEISFAAAN